MSYGDFCYFKDNPLTIDLHNHDTCDTINKYIINLNGNIAFKSFQNYKN